MITELQRKKIILVSLFTLFVIFVGLVIYAVFFRSEKRPTEFPTDAGRGVEDTAFPDIGAGTLPSGDGVSERVTDIGPGALPSVRERAVRDKSLITRQIQAPVKNPSPTRDGATNFYNSSDGKFYGADAKGQIKELSDKVFFNVEKVTWSPTTDESIIEYPDGSNIYYNFATKKQVTLPKHWADFDFAPQGDRIAAKSIALAPENRWLITSKPDGTGVKLVEPMGQNADRVTVDWSPTNQIVALSRTGAPLGADRQEVLLIGQNKENFKSVVVEGRGLETSWSPSGKKLLHSVYNARNQYKPELWIVDASGNNIGANRKLLNVNTWASKCAMADDRFIYCGVPETLDVGAGFAPSLADSTPDRIIKIDALTGVKTDLELEDFHVVENMFVSQDGSKIMFTDKTQIGIFEIPLK